jgi:hypothetical protein
LLLSLVVAIVVAAVVGGSMLQGIWRSFFTLGSLLVIYSCGVNPDSRTGGADGSAPKYLIARADVKDKTSSSTNVEFVSVNSHENISSAADAEQAYLAGEPIVRDESGRMRLSSTADVEFSLGSPAQMPSQMPTQMGTTKINKNCYGADCGPTQMQTVDSCECSYGNGVVRSKQNGVLFPRLRSFFQRLNPSAKVGNDEIGYNYGNQYSQGQYQYTVYKQNQPAPVNPGSSQQPGTQYQMPSGPQNPSNPQMPPPAQGPNGQEPMPGALTGL